MNLEACRLVLRPRGPLEVLDLTLRLWATEWRVFTRMALWICAMPWLVLSGLTVLLDGHWGGLAAAIALAPLVQAPFTLLTGRLLFDSDVGPVSVLWDLISRVPSLLGTWLWWPIGLILTIPTCGYGLPVLHLGLLYSTEVALLERHQPFRNLTRGLRLAVATLPQSGVGVIVRWVGTAWCALVAEAFGQSLVGVVLQLGEPFGSLWGGQITPFVLAGVLLAHVGWSVYRVLLYLDVRTRTEGWDLQVGMMAAAVAR
jgi:hypothetical protein